MKKLLALLIVGLAIVATGAVFAAETYNGVTYYCGKLQERSPVELYKAIDSASQCDGIKSRATCEPYVADVMIGWREKGNIYYAGFHATEKCTTNGGTFVF